MKNGVDYFYEGKIVPATIKDSIYKMENDDVQNKSVFEDVLSGLLEEFMTKKNIFLAKVEKINVEKLKRLNTYVMTYRNAQGDEFKCSYLDERGSLKFGTTSILASSMIFTFAGHGCKYCKYSNPDCEFCNRKKIDKIFTPESRCSLKHNMEELTKVFGEDSINSIRDFCEGYCNYMRNYVNEKNIEQQSEENENIPEPLQDLLKVDTDVVDYLISVITTILGEYTSGNTKIREILDGKNYVEKSMLVVLTHLKKLSGFIKIIKQNPENISPEILQSIGESFGEDEESFDIYDQGDDDDDDDDDGDSWKKGSDDDV